MSHVREAALRGATRCPERDAHAKPVDGSSRCRGYCSPQSHRHPGFRRCAGRHAGSSVSTTPAPDVITDHRAAFPIHATGQPVNFAHVVGLNVRWLNLLIVVVAALAVAISMRTVGLLLISALMVIPVAASQQLFVGFKAAFYGAMGIGVLSALVGTAGSLYLESALGATIVVSSIVLLGLAAIVSGPLNRRRQFIPYIEDHGQHEHEEAEPHDDRHDPASHTMIQHGDHIDYVHDGHRHYRHGDHYDEH